MFIKFATDKDTTNHIRISDIKEVEAKINGGKFRINITTSVTNYYEEYITQEERDERLDKIISVLNYDMKADILAMIGINYARAHEGSVMGYGFNEFCAALGYIEDTLRE